MRLNSGSPSQLKGATAVAKTPNGSASVFQHDAPDHLSGAQLVDPFLDVAYRFLLHRRRLDLAAAGEPHQFLSLGQRSDHEAFDRHELVDPLHHRPAEIAA